MYILCIDTYVYMYIYNIYIHIHRCLSRTNCPDYPVSLLLFTELNPKCQEREREREREREQ